MLTRTCLVPLVLLAACGVQYEEAPLDAQTAMTPYPAPDTALSARPDVSSHARTDGASTSTTWRVAPNAPTYSVQWGWLQGPDGRRLLGLRPELWVSLRPTAKAPAARRIMHRRRFSPLRAAVNNHLGWQLVARAREGFTHYELRLTSLAGDPRIQLELKASYRDEVLVEAEVLTFEVTTPPPGRLMMLDRAYRQRRVRRPLFVGPLTPHLVSIRRPEAQVTLVGGAGVQALRVIPLAGGRHRLGLELDHPHNHPFQVMDRCTVKRQHHPTRRSLSAGRRCRRSQRLARATLLLGPASVPVAMRYPAGRRAALVFSDHADQSDAAKLEAFAFGRTGALERPDLRAPRGFVGHGLTYTKTIFTRRRGAYAAQLDDPRYRLVLDAMARRGVEVGLHSTTGLPDPPNTLKRELETFRALYAGRTWIDHQPDTNCEAVSCRGWDPRGRWYVLPLLRNAGVRYVWSGRDLQLPRDSLNMLLLPHRSDVERPVAYQHTRLEPCEAPGPKPHLVLFNTSMLFEDRRRFLRRFEPQRLDQLEAEHGLLIAHVYLDTYRRQGRFKARSLLRPLGGLRYALRPEVDALFARLARRQARETLWVAPVDHVLDHLLAAQQTEIRHLPDGAAQVRAPTALVGLTLRLPAPAGATALVDGAPPVGQRREGGDLVLWFDARGDGPHRLELRDARGEPLLLLRGARVELR